MSDAAHYNYRFSHQLEDGHSGPARSYWDIVTARGANLATICLHHNESGAWPEGTAQRIVHLLEQAFEAGRTDKVRELKKALSL